MELLYNPTLMSEAEIKATFVARQGLVDELLDLVARQPEGAGVQHVVVIAPRGMGKTTVLLMGQFAMNDRGLTSRWQVVKFCEESYSINDLADLWLEVINLLGADTGDMELLRRGDQLKATYGDSGDLHEAAFALIKDWAREHGKRLLLLVDNVDLILEQINDERDNARLRDVLMNDGTMMLIGAASTFFREARAYEQPLYNFFKIYDLAPLTRSEIHDLLRQRAAADEKPNFEDFLEKNTARLRVLEHFTGGNPRLVLMLYRVVVRSEVTEVLQGLEKLLDEVTPYYKAKIESLPPQQRKILDHIARVSGRTWEGVTPTDIARATRLRPNQVSAQLKRLSDLGYVRAADLRERASWYTLSEPLYALYHQMRFGRAVRQRMQWLVNFMKVWYQAEELGPECDRLTRLFHEKLGAGDLREARETLEFRRYLVEAMAGSPSYRSALDSAIRDYVQLQDSELLKRELSRIDLGALEEETLKKLLDAGYIGQEEFDHASGAVLASAETRRQAEADAAFRFGVAAFEAGRHQEALGHFDRVAELVPGSYPAHFIRFALLLMLGRAPEALAGAEHALELRKDEFPAWFLAGTAQISLGRLAPALASLDQAVAIKPDEAGAWIVRAAALQGLGRADEALGSCERALEIQADLPSGWLLRAEILRGLGRYSEALASLERLVEYAPNESYAWFSRGLTLGALGRHQDALASFDRVLAMGGEEAHAWFNRALTLEKLGRFEEALASYDRGLATTPHNARAWLNRAMLLRALRRYDDALESTEQALAIEPDDVRARIFHGVQLISMDRPGEALRSLDQAVQIDPHGVVPRLERLLAHMMLDDRDLVRQDWREAVKNAHPIEDWGEKLTEFLLEVARVQELGFVRELVAEGGLEDRLFPLARALDYLLTGDGALIEKLSPEVRGIVEEIVKKLGPPKQAASKPPRRKVSVGPRHRIRKQLH